MSTGSDTPTPDTPGTSSSGKPAGKFWAIAGVIALLVGVGGFFLGESVKGAQYDKGKAKYQAIYDTGYASGQRSGSAAGQAAGQASGNAQGQRIGKAQGLVIGKRAGEAAGQAAGQKAGYASGYTAGVVAGASDALGALGNWNTNVPYVVELDPSPVKGVPVQVYSRTLMLKGYSYFLCPDGKTACNTKLLG